jgi:hypothetical protein
MLQIVEVCGCPNWPTSRMYSAEADPNVGFGVPEPDRSKSRLALFSEAARQRGICPAIPYRSKTKDIPAFFPKVLYKGRARIEQAVSKLKRFKRIALRCEKTERNYGSFVALALGFIFIKSVHTAGNPPHCHQTLIDVRCADSL